MIAAVHTRRPRLQPHTASERTHNAPRRQQCKCSASNASQVQLAGAISRERATQMVTTVRCKLSSQARDRLSLAPQHTMREAKSTVTKASPYTQAPVARSRGGKRHADKTSRMHAPGRFHQPAPCGNCRRPPARCWSARAAAPVCFDLCSYRLGTDHCRPGPAVRSRCHPSPTPALSHSKRKNTPHRGVSNASAVRAMQVK
eukprot:COSAG06_NODE_17206_length_954_cov_4.230409_1_plen_200_part_10